jgi:hypothetical protein
MFFEIFKFVFETLKPVLGDRRKIRLTVHRAYFLNSARECYFINITNLSRTREVEVTHVWFDSTPQVPAQEPARPLPNRLKPDESWETWVDVGRLPEHLQEAVYGLARARLSNGATIKSKKNEEVPQEGNVPGGPS